MKKLFIILAFTMLSQAAKPQSPCEFFPFVNGNSVSLYYNWPMIAIYTLDSIKVDFGNGANAFYTAPNFPQPIIYNYPSPGTYNICLTRYISQIGVGIPIPCTYCDSVTVGVTTGCQASANFGYLTSMLNVFFNNFSSCLGCSSTSYSWDFGDGSPINTQQNPTHTYAAPGQYNVCLSITGVNSTGTCTDTYCDSVYVMNTSPCIIDAQFTSTTSGNTVTFNNLSTCNTCVFTTYDWDFGDGSSSSATSPTHTYTSPGSYNVCLYAVGFNAPNNFCMDSMCTNITITGSGGCTANADFTYSGSGGNYSFTNTSTCSGCTSQTYLWTFGDGGAPSTQTNPTRVYTTNGPKNVCLVMYGQNSGTACVDTTCKTINVVLSGVDDVVKNVLNLYPNPTNQSITVDLPESERVNSVILLDATGRVLMRKAAATHEEKLKLNVENLSKGIYMLKLSTDKRSYLNQFIKN